MFEAIPDLTMLNPVGAKVYLCTRSIERGHAALDDIRKEIGIANSKRVIVSGMDLASTSSIRKFVKDFLKSSSRALLLFFITFMACFPS